MRGYEVHVRRHFDPATVEIWVVDGRGRVLRDGTWHEQETDARWSGPTLRLDPATAETLWQELTRELRLDVALPEGKQREDYLHERGRVDELIEHLMTVDRRSS